MPREIQLHNLQHSNGEYQIVYKVEYGRFGGNKTSSQSAYQNSYSSADSGAYDSKEITIEICDRIRAKHTINDYESHVRCKGSKIR